MSLACLFIPFSFKEQAFLILIKSSVSIRSMYCIFGVIFNKLQPNPGSQSFFPTIFFLEDLQIQVLNRSMVHFELIAVYDAKLRIEVHSFFFFNTEVLLFLHPLLKRLSFLHQKPLHLCHKSIYHIDLCIYLSTPSHSIGLFVYVDTNTILSQLLQL